MFELQCCRQNA